MATCQKSALAGQFHSEYERLCFLQDVCPISYVTANLKENFIDINVDRIRENEWNAIFDALKINNSLRFIALRSSWTPSTSEDKKRKQHGKKRTPAIRSRDMTLRLAKSLKDCLKTSQCLECLVIQNLPFREPDVRLLSKGLSTSTHLKHFSMEQCHIGDDLFELLVMSVKKSLSLISINFSACNLTWKSAEQVAVIIKYQAAQRHGEAWQDSLRYRRPDLDRMSGLHRVTLCDNSISDSGARILADALKDDLWLKALDLQNCSISADGALILKESLAFNRSLWVLDLRRNQQIEYDLLRSIIEQVMINAGGEHSEYPWISSEETRNKLKQKSAKSPTSVKRKAVRSSIKVRKKDNPDTTFTTSKSMLYSKSVHYPWRTGERIKRNCYITNNPLVNGHDPTQTQFLQQQHQHPYQNCDTESFSDPVGEPISKKNEYAPGYLEEVKRLKMEVNFYKQKFEEERKSQSHTYSKLVEVQEQNKVLKEEVERLKYGARNQVNLKSSDLDDENVLNGIESSFQQFQQFLDMLEEVGLGDLYVQMQEKNQSDD